MVKKIEIKYLTSFNLHRVCAKCIIINSKVIQFINYKKFLIKKYNQSEYINFIIINISLKSFKYHKFDLYMEVR